MASEPETLTLEAMEKDMGAAVYLPLPSDPSPELVKMAHWNAEYFYEAEQSVADRDVRRGVGDPEAWLNMAVSASSPMRGQLGYGVDPQVNADKALARMEELEKLDPTLERMNPSGQVRERPEVYQGQGKTVDEAIISYPPDGGGSPSYVPMPRQAPNQPPLDAVGVEAAGQDARGKSDALGDPGRDQIKPNQKAESMVSHDQFSAAARQVRDAGRDQPERDLAEVINHMADTIGAKDTPAHSAFKQHQADLSDQISREPDAEQRAALRLDREAHGHTYAADLSQEIAGRALAAGHMDEARDALRYAETQREIAGELRNPTPPDRGEPQTDAREQFAKDAAEVGKEVLGRTAETIMVAEGPKAPETAEAQPDGAAARSRAVRGFERAVIVGAAPGGGMVLTEVNQDAREPKALTAASIDAEAAEQAQSLAYEPSQTSRAERQEELEAAGGTAPSAKSTGDWAKDALAEVRREAEKDNEGQGGPERPEGLSVGTAAGRYVSLGR